MVYTIQAQVTWTTKDGYRTSKGVPTFFLDSNIQGIVDTEHAEAIAKNMLEPTEQFTAYVTASECPSAVVVHGLYEGDSK